MSIQIFSIFIHLDYFQFEISNSVTDSAHRVIPLLVNFGADAIKHSAADACFANKAELVTRV